MEDFPLEEMEASEASVAAARDGRPIRTPGDMPRPLSWRPMDPAWKAAVLDKWWAREYSGGRDARLLPLLPLRDLLLSFGGEEACLPAVEEELRQITERGQLWYGDRREMMPGQPSRCHANTAALWEANRDRVFVATGYALSDDGMWRQHSWGVKPGGTIVETTMRREAYFGYVLTADEAEKFLFDNY